MWNRDLNERRLTMKTNGILVLGCCMFACGASADITWPGTAGGDIDVAANWGETLPSSSEMAFFSTVQTGPLTLSGDSMTFYRLKFDAPGTNVFDLGAGKSALASNRIFFKGGTTVHLKSGTMGVAASGDRIFMGDDQNVGNVSYGGNTLIVDGASSIFRSAGTASSSEGNTFIGLGVNNANNTILVRNGGTVDGAVRIGSNQKYSTNNVLRVTGAGSSFTGMGNRRFEVGACGGWNLAEFLDGATMTASSAVIVGNYQFINNDSAKGYWRGPCNTLRLSGTGTTGSVAGKLYVGLGSSSNRLEVASGARLNVLGALYVGTLGTSGASGFPDGLARNPCGNELIVDEGALLRHGVENQAGTLNFVIGDADLQDGVENGMRVRGTYIRDAARTTGYVGLAGARSFLDIDGGTVAITNSGNMIVGRAATAVGSSISISNGGLYEHCATNGSYWLYCGYEAPGCSIRVDGATLRQIRDPKVSTSAPIGMGCALSASNSVVSCANGGLIDVERIVVGDVAPNCVLAVTNSTVKISTTLDVGYSDFSATSCPSNCAVLISGTNASIAVGSSFRFRRNSRIEYTFPADKAIASPVIRCDRLDTTYGDGLSVVVRVERGRSRRSRSVELIRTTGTAIGDTTYNRLSFDLPEGVTIERQSNAIVAHIAANKGIVVSFK